MTAPYADAPGAIRPTLAVVAQAPADRYDPTYPDYAPEIRAPHHDDSRWPDSDHLKASLWAAKTRYGKHSRWNTKAARKSDPRRSFRVHDAILDQVAERNVLAGVGRPVVRRSA